MNAEVRIRQRVLPSPRAIMKAIRAGVGLGLGPRLVYFQPQCLPRETGCEIIQLLSTNYVNFDMPLMNP